MPPRALHLSKELSRLNFSRSLPLTSSTLTLPPISTPVEPRSYSVKDFRRSQYCGVFLSPKRYSSGRTMSTEAGERDKCVFCKIADGKEGNEIFYQDEQFVVFQDIKPAAKHHLLVVPREHIRDSKSLTPSQLPLAQRLVEIGKQTLLSQMKKDSPDLESLPADLKILMGYHWPPFHSISHLHLHVIAPSDQMSIIARTVFRPNSYWFVTPEYIQDRLEKMAAGVNGNGGS